MTHDQADFDAIASLFAVSKIENIQAVLPPKLNKNVNSFLILYGIDFLFLESKDISNEAISDVILVDTQSLFTLKGITKKTKVRIIDHHPLRLGDENVDSLLEQNKQTNRLVEIVDLGATTTYFVEEIQQKRIGLSAVQATLLLLAIYEDTGSLTYSKTTPRDVRAVAWLIEQGAILQSIPEFLNPPMSDQQIVVYDILVENMEYLQVKGHRVMVSHADVPIKVDEISTLAHKIRDLFEPSAVFIIVKTPEGIRMIARSSNDDINVAEIAAQFGGGGHQRAASALLKPEKPFPIEISEIKKQLILTVQQKIKPSITVAKLMSKKPKVLSPEMPVEEAGQLMLKYGYEGFPVLEHGKVIGLLTRRSVDRARKHKLNFKVSNIMDAGSYKVAPDDPIQQVQSVMTESGWGQIPVIDPSSNKLIGIVTRTDLIKILAKKRHAYTTGKNIEIKLIEYLDPEVLKLIKSISQCSADLNFPVYLVGGFVRDLLLNYPSTDIDCVIEGDAIAVGEQLFALFGGRLTSHSRFGTARWYLPPSFFVHKSMPEFVDLITARQEFYERPSVLPSVEYGNIKHDLHRRDFTINTLAIRIDPDHYGELHDYYGGKSDLDKKVIRVLHSLSFIDDPTRMIRAARYEQRYAFSIDDRTIQLMKGAKSLLGHLSQERLRHELDLIMMESDPAAIFNQLEQWGLFLEISPALIWNDTIKDRLQLTLRTSLPMEWPLPIDLAKEETFNNFAYCLWFATFPPEQINAIQTRLGFPIKVLNQLIQTSTLIDQLAADEVLEPYQWVKRFENVEVLPLLVAYLLTNQPAIITYLQEWKKIQTKIDGDTLREMGLRPGPYFHKIINQLKAARINGIIHTDQEEQNYLQMILMEFRNKDTND